MRWRLAGTVAVAAILVVALANIGRMPSDPIDIAAIGPPARVARPVVGVYDPGLAFADAGGIGIEHVYVYWQQLDQKMLRQRIDYAAQRGRRMLITVEPYTHAADWRGGAEHLFTDILAGDFDAEIAVVCAEVARAGEGTIVRWGHEMEQPQARYPWTRGDPDGYRSAYRYFVERCRAGAPQARFMWSPKGEGNLADYYPGDDWVDMVGLSVYGLQAWDRRYFGSDRSFAQVLGEKYRRVARFGKPVAIAEFGVAGSEDYRRTWLEDSARRLAKFPRLEAIVYFNAEEPSSWPGDLGSPDWRVVPATLLR